MAEPNFVNSLFLSTSKYIFTIDTEENGKLPFLDVLVSKKDGTLGHQVHRKSIYIDRYLYAESHPQHRQHKNSLQSIYL